MNNYIIVMDKFGGAHLEHKAYKYLTKEWKNGHWVYHYPTITKDPLQTGAFNSITYNMNTVTMGKASDRIAEANKNANFWLDQYKYWTKEISHAGNKERKRECEEKAAKAKQNYDKYGKEARRLRDQANKAAAENRATDRKLIKLDQKNPFTKLSEYAHKGADFIKKQRGK